jgi:hypothetical protein
MALDLSDIHLKFGCISGGFFVQQKHFLFLFSGRQLLMNEHWTLKREIPGIKNRFDRFVLKKQLVWYCFVRFIELECWGFLAHIFLINKIRMVSDIKILTVLTANVMNGHRNKTCYFGR